MAKIPETFLLNKKTFEFVNSNKNFMIFNPSIEWSDDNKRLFIVSRIAGTKLVPQLKMCLNKDLNNTSKIDVSNFNDYSNLFDNKSYLNGIVYFETPLDNKQKQMTAKIINPLFNKSSVCYETSTGFEDPRIFKYKGQLWIISVHRSNSKKKCIHNLIIFPLNMQKNPITLYYKKAKSLEKNWMPFEYNNELLIVYSIEPHIILSVNTDTGECIERYYSSSIKKIVNKNDIGNGAPPKKININNSEYYIGIGHERKLLNNNLVRKNFFYLFETYPPFQIREISKSFNINPEFTYIEFVSGLLVDQNNKNIYISYGVDDCYSGISMISFNDVTNLFKVFSNT